MGLNTDIILVVLNIEDEVSNHIGIGIFSVKIYKMIFMYLLIL